MLVRKEKSEGIHHHQTRTRNSQLATRQYGNTAIRTAPLSHHSPHSLHPPYHVVVWWPGGHLITLPQPGPRGVRADAP